MPTLAEKYPILTVWSEEDGRFVATSPAFPGLTGVDENELAAIAELREAIAMAIELMEEEGRSLPEVRARSSYSGQFRLRLSKTAHGELARRAEEEGVSLNALAVELINHGLGISAGVRHASLQLDAAAERLQLAVSARERAMVADARATAELSISGSTPAFGVPLVSSAEGRSGHSRSNS